MSETNVNHDERVDAAMATAERLFGERTLHRPEARTGLLRAAADALEQAGDDLVAAAIDETALGEPRLRNELGRTTGQLRLFADEVADGGWLDARIDTGDVDVRSINVPLGPVVVFAASNFPLAFSVPGGDTASAWAAGCPVVVKAHPAHPRTSEIAAETLRSAAAAAELPADVIQVLAGDVDLGLALVDHPATAAVGFTGSLTAGRALYDRAAARPTPIPVYAEMGSVNPVFILPGALRTRSDELADGLAGSVTLGVGQFCTNPGLAIGVGLDGFATDLAGRLAETPAATMLYEGIGRRYETSVAALAAVDGVELLAGSPAAGTPVGAAASAAVFEAHPELHEEVFGPSTLVVSCDDADAMLRIAAGLEGQLTATVHGDPDDADDVALAATLFDVLVDKAGRLIWNGYPTGVAVTHAMQHGGPYPASTDSRTTSVGTAAMRRFLRPVAYQETPEALLPEPLRDANSAGWPRRVNGTWTRDPISP